MRNPNNAHSIRFKITLLAIVPLLIVSLLLLGYALIGGLRSTVSTLKASISETADISALAVQNQLDVYEAAVREAASHELFQDENFDSEQAMELLNGMKERYGFQRVGYTDANGINQKGSDFSERQYFHNCRDTLASVTSDPYASKDNEGALSVLFCAPIVRNGQFCGIVYGASDAELFTDIIKDVIVGEHGKNFILDSSGTIIAHTDDALATSLTNYITEAQTDASVSAYADATSKMLDTQSGILLYRDNGSYRFASYAPIAKGSGWVLAVTVNAMDFLRGQLAGLFVLLIVSVAIIIVSMLLIAKTARRMAAPISNCTKRMELLAEGDLTSDVAHCSANDETGLLVASTQRNIQHLNSMIGSISESLEQMASGDFTHTTTGDFRGDFAPIQRSLNNILQSMRTVLTEIDKTAKVLSDISSQVVDASSMLNTGVQNQNMLVSEIRSAFDSMKENIRANAENTNNVVALSSKTQDDVKFSRSEMQHLLDAMGEMSALSKEMQSITAVVSDIAFQTHILSINAAIEAAAAGDAGKSFGVVSNEIGRLAAQSGESADKISELIERIAASIQNSQDLTKNVSDSFTTVSDITSTVEQHISEISASSEEQAAWIDSVTEKMDTISAEVQNTSASATRASEISEQLREEADKLKEHIHTFRL